MKARETTYTQTLSLVGNYMIKERSGFADIPVIVSVVAFTALAGLAASILCFLGGVITLSRWAERKIAESNTKLKVEYAPIGRPHSPRTNSPD